MKPLSLEQKWELVRQHYNAANYRHPKTRAPLKLTVIPKPEIVEDLYIKMKKLYDSEWEYKQSRVRL